MKITEQTDAESTTSTTSTDSNKNTPLVPPSFRMSANNPDIVAKVLEELKKNKLPDWGSHRPLLTTPNIYQIAEKAIGMDSWIYDAMKESNYSAKDREDRIINTSALKTIRSLMEAMDNISNPDFMANQLKSDESRPLDGLGSYGDGVGSGGFAPLNGGNMHAGFAALEDNDTWKVSSNNGGFSFASKSKTSGFKGFA